MLYGVIGHGEIDHNLHNHVLDDVICKPPIDLYVSSKPIKLIIIHIINSPYNFSIQNCSENSVRTSIFYSIVQAVHYQRTVHAMTSLYVLKQLKHI